MNVTKDLEKKINKEYKTGNVKSAIELCQIGLQDDPTNADLHVRLGDLYLAWHLDIYNSCQYIDEAITEYQRALETYIDSVTAEKVIYAMHACPHGVLGMSHDIEGLVETSTNLASIKMKENHTILVGTSQRSSIESYKEMAANQVASTFLLAGAEVSHGDGYPGWAPNPDSVIQKVAQETYERLFHKQPEIMAIHAGLECGLFLEKYPTLDMISFGPTLRDVHSPNERIEIKTVGMWWSHLLELLKNIPVK